MACGETGVERFTAALEPLGRELEGVRCVQVLTHGDEVWVHALAGSRHAPVSELYRLGAEGARRVRTFDRVHLLSIDAGGRMLARDTTLDAEHRTDRVLHPDGTDALVRDLGRFDAFNHSVRVDHRSELWFLRGTPPASHQAKTLCVVEADGTVRTALAWDEGTSHRMEACATATGDGALVTGYRLHHPHPGKGERWIACRPLDGGPATWRVRWPWAPVALATVPTLGLVLVATLDGRLAALDRATGECLASEVLAAGTRVSPLCLAVAGTRAAVGTLDGRILRLDLGGTRHAVRRPPPDGLHPHGSREPATDRPAGMVGSGKLTG